MGANHQSSPYTMPLCLGVRGPPQASRHCVAYESCSMWNHYSSSSLTAYEPTQTHTRTRTRKLTHMARHAPYSFYVGATG